VQVLVLFRRCSPSPGFTGSPSVRSASAFVTSWQASMALDVMTCHAWPSRPRAAARGDVRGFSPPPLLLLAPGGARAGVTPPAAARHQQSGRGIPWHMPRRER
jgi:hypothetical protein